MALPAPRPSIDTCNACGKLFPRVSMRLCTQCVHVEENRFQLVRDYLLEHDGAAVGEIAGQTGVSASDVRCFLEGGRLISVSDLGTSCTCGGIGERCRYCRSRLSNTFRDMEATMQRDIAERGADHRTTGDDGRARYVRRIRRIGTDQQP